MIKLNASAGGAEATRCQGKGTTFGLQRLGLNSEQSRSERAFPSGLARC